MSIGAGLVRLEVAAQAFEQDVGAEYTLKFAGRTEQRIGQREGERERHRTERRRCPGQAAPFLGRHVPGPLAWIEVLHPRGVLGQDCSGGIDALDRPETLRHALGVDEPELPELCSSAGDPPSLIGEEQVVDRGFLQYLLQKEAAELLLVVQWQLAMASERGIERDDALRKREDGIHLAENRGSRVAGQREARSPDIVTRVVPNGGIEERSGDERDQRKRNRELPDEANTRHATRSQSWLPPSPAADERGARLRLGDTESRFRATFVASANRSSHWDWLSGRT